MKALILVGGYGTRLRPLTLSVPKPLIAFCNKTIVEHQIEALVEAGVNHVVLAVNYQPEALASALKRFEARFQIKISCSQEEEPLGTAGPIKLAEKLLMTPDVPGAVNVEDESFFVFNSDVICDFPLKEFRAYHDRHGGEGTILVTKVVDPSKFGVVVSNEAGKIEAFVEKPESFVGDQINAGLYLLKKKMISRIELRPTSIERETFPAMAREGTLYSKILDGYWADIGQPKDYLTGMQLFLNRMATRHLISDPNDNTTPQMPSTSQIPSTSQTSTSQTSTSQIPQTSTRIPQTSIPQASSVKVCDDNTSSSSSHEDLTPSASVVYSGSPRVTDGVRSSVVLECGVVASKDRLASGIGIVGDVLIHPTATLGRGCVIGPNVTIGAGCCVGDGVRMTDCALMECTKVKDFAMLSRVIVGWKGVVGRWVRMENLTVLGEDVHIQEECYINGAFILPHKVITHNVREAGSVIM